MPSPAPGVLGSESANGAQVAACGLLRARNWGRDARKCPREKKKRGADTNCVLIVTASTRRWVLCESTRAKGRALANTTISFGCKGKQTSPGLCSTGCGHTPAQWVSLGIKGAGLCKSPQQLRTVATATCCEPSSHDLPASPATRARRCDHMTYPVPANQASSHSAAHPTPAGSP